MHFRGVNHSSCSRQALSARRAAPAATKCPAMQLTRVQRDPQTTTVHSRLSHGLSCRRLSLQPAAATQSPSLYRQHTGRPSQAAGSAAASTDQSPAYTSIGNLDTANCNGHPLNHQQLLDLGASFVKSWFTGIAKGPQSVEQPLSRILHQDVTLMRDMVRLLEDRQGFSGVLAELERAHLEYHRSEHHPMLYAASEESQMVYALVEGTYQDVGALPGHPATFRISKVHHILALAVTQGRVEKLWLRRQLTEEDKDELLHDPLTCYPAPFPRDSLMLTDAATHELAAEKMKQSVTAWWTAWSSAAASSGITISSSSSSGGTGDSSLALGGVDSSPAVSSPESTMAAASGGTATRARRGLRGASAAAQEALLQQLLAPGYRMWDAYGLWPAMRASGRRHLTKESAVQYLQQLRYNYNISWQVLDAAVAEGGLACFCHWQARFEPRWPATQPANTVPNVPARPGGGVSPPAAGTGVTPANSSKHADGNAAQQDQSQTQQQSGEPASSEDRSFIVEGLEIDIFNEQLQLQDTWMFRGPITDAETKLFLEFDRQQAAAEAALAASEQQVIRQARREQREQQLSELVAWMNQYQQQWGDYVKHVQKALERQQELAKAQIKQQVYVVDQLQQHYQKLQQEQRQQYEQLQQQQQAAEKAAEAAQTAAAQITQLQAEEEAAEH